MAQPQQKVRMIVTGGGHILHASPNLEVILFPTGASMLDVRKFQTMRPSDIPAANLMLEKQEREHEKIKKEKDKDKDKNKKPKGGE